MALARNTNPLKAPWPPGVDFRIVDAGRLGLIGQLRPGATMPPEAALELEYEIRHRAPEPCASCSLN